uniref:Rab-GAP TBC domain-containing protein n=1 Tax=Parastrongyloides trichosuri TaxID=131310 RepID=A0A0N4ZCK3_PARTI
MEGNSNEKVLCSIRNVIRESRSTGKQQINGTFSFRKNQYGVFLCWMSSDASFTLKEESLLNPEREEKEDDEFLKMDEFRIDIVDIKSYYMVEPKKGSGGTTNKTTIQFICKDGSSTDKFYLYPLDTLTFTSNMQEHCTIQRSARERNLVIVMAREEAALQESVKLLNLHGDFMARMIQNPYATSLTALGKVKNFVENQLINGLLDNDAVSVEESMRQIESLRVSEDAESVVNSLRSHDDQGFELITHIELPKKIEFYREKPITLAIWNSFKDSEGRITKVNNALQAIFRGGLEPELRKDVWKYLLKYNKWHFTVNENKAHRKKLEEEYYKMKMIWMSMSDDIMSRFSIFNEHRSLIEKDVIRTDRSHPFFQNGKHNYLQLMTDILTTSVIYNFDLGYVQGMSDYLATLLVVMENEVDTFWCFVGLMERVHKNFDMDQIHIRNKLTQLRDLLMIINPRFVRYLESHESGHMFFCFRWVLVEFKREFSFKDIMTLWEVLWTDVPCENFLLLFCLAVLDKQANIIMNNNFGLTETLKHINNLSMTINLDEMLTEAESLYHQLAILQDKLPTNIRDILGFNNE